MIPELHSEVIVIVHLPLQPCVNAARICIKVHDHLFIVEDCKHAQTFLSFGSPHIGRAAAHGPCLNIRFFTEHVFAEYRLQWQHRQCTVAPLW